MRMTYAQEIVASADGTRIAYRTTGRGADVIVVPGAFARAADLAAFADELGSRFTVHVLERRGRGASGDRPDAYSIERECEDVAALQLATGATLVFGHSFGGLVALEAALRTPALTKVAAYEPGVSIGGSVPTGWIERSRDLLARGRGLAAFASFVRAMEPEAAGRLPEPLLTPILLLVMRRDERRQKVELLPTAIREHLEAARLDDTHRRYAAITAEVLLLRGAKGPTAARVAHTLSQLQTALQRATVVTYSGLDHFGPEKKPHETATAVADFFGARASPPRAPWTSAAHSNRSCG
jgi:pimeloyl-ACP methyl ester carboxylesterase